MKKILYISLVIPLLLTTGCFDEEEISSEQTQSFVKFFNNYPIFYGVDAEQVPGSGYALLGTVEEPVTGNTEICLLRTNEYGNTIDSARYYGRSLDDKAYRLRVLSDGGFAILGSSQNPVTGKQEVFFIRTNSVGDIIWTRTIGSTLNLEALDFEIDHSGSFIMTGYVESSTPATNKQVWIWAIDQDGNNPMWSAKIYGAEKDDEGRHIQIMGDGGYVITGVTSSYPSGTPVSHAFLLRTNSSGLSSGFDPLPSTENEEGNCIRILDAETFLILCTVKSTTSVSGADIRLKKVQKILPFEPELIWEKTYANPGNDIGQCLLTEGTSIFILGTTATASTKTAISLISTDSEGNNPVYSIFGLETQLSGSSLEFTSDNGFIISGTNKLSESSASATLIKTRPDGSL